MINRQRIRLVFIPAFLSFLLFCGCHGRAVKKACVKNICLQAEIAASEPDRRRGLLFRRGLADNQGMLFIFDKEGQYNFWMKNMRFPLDIIWIDAQKIVVDMTKNALPCKDSCAGLIAAGAVKYVLEIKSGFIEKNGVKIGDSVDF